MEQAEVIAQIAWVGAPQLAGILAVACAIAVGLPVLLSQVTNANATPETILRTALLTCVGYAMFLALPWPAGWDWAVTLSLPWRANALLLYLVSVAVLSSPLWWLSTTFAWKDAHGTADWKRLGVGVLTAGVAAALVAVAVRVGVLSGLEHSISPVADAGATYEGAVLSWLPHLAVWAYAEEVLFREAIPRFVRRLLPSPTTKSAIVTAGFVSSIWFGISHAVMATGSAWVIVAVSAAVGGLLFVARCRWGLATAVWAHLVFNTVTELLPF